MPVYESLVLCLLIIDDEISIQFIPTLVVGSDLYNITHYLTLSVLMWPYSEQVLIITR